MYITKYVFILCWIVDWIRYFIYICNLWQVMTSSLDLLKHTGMHGHISRVIPKTHFSYPHSSSTFKFKHVFDGGNVEMMRISNPSCISQTGFILCAYSYMSPTRL